MADERILSPSKSGCRYTKRAAQWLGGSFFAEIRCVYSTFTFSIPTTFRSLIIRTEIMTTRRREEKSVFIGLGYFA
jgi:hypothetical protein